MTSTYLRGEKRATILAQYLAPGEQPGAALSLKSLNFEEEDSFSLLPRAPSTADFITYFAAEALIYDHGENSGKLAPRFSEPHDEVSHQSHHVTLLAGELYCLFYLRHEVGTVV